MLISSPKQPFLLVTILITILLLGPGPILARNAHVINFRSPNLYPESLTWDPRAQHFLLGSLRQRIIAAVSDAGVVETFISDTDLPADVAFLGLAVDSPRNRLLAVVHSSYSLPPFNALAAYDLRSRRRLFLSSLPSEEIDAANDVAVDHRGNAFVTNSGGNFIWKVTTDGSASIFSTSPMYKTATEIPANDNDTAPHGSLGLNGIAYVSKGYLLVVQSSTGKVFKVDAVDGTARKVLLNEDLVGADDIAVRKDGAAAVVSPLKELWLVKSIDSWAEGTVYDNVEVNVRRFPTSVVVGDKERVYVLYGHLDEGRMGDSGRESFGIAELRSKKEGQDESIWIFVLIGIGLAYFCFWRFQMGQLVKKMDKIN
ncbi:hypothetical protein AAZX31_08G251600 [Glycine max]|uniref:SMP-30/Gluconolactonase/LRE-like region domain-containing protein n=1 Tax=Glycine soja TaxID=3848 RepID=A0A445JK25_GLYSO|nr:uncharacterized protein LOC114422809 [Glycine soja]KAG5026576.1 hypothetical protein JHK86_022490 [Glycine max]KAH1238606.1 hypothetical protein GmHk_08G023236 [Glycine max]RZB98835.1 hypothetical protein D0Y65_021629 [Glycine soja]